MRKYLLISMTLLLTVTVVLGLSGIKKSSQEEVEQLKSAVKIDPTLLKKKAMVGNNLRKFNADGSIESALRGRSITLSVSDSVIFFDDFEGTIANWIPDASWNNVEVDVGLPTAGFALAPTSTWSLVTDNSNSATHSWNNPDASDQQTDMVISPVIYLPDSVHAFGVNSLMKGGVISLYLDADFTATDDQFRLHLGSAEVLWEFSTADSAPEGTSAWLVVSPLGADNEQFRHWLYTPDIDLSAEATVDLDFMHKSISEPAFDYNVVDVSTDGWVTYDNVWNIAGGAATGGTASWTAVNVNLDTYAGQTIQLRFTSKGDFGTTEAGAHWALDDIVVSGNVTASLFSDDGGDTPTTMTAEGYTPGNQLFILGAGANPTPSWSLWVEPSDIFDGSNGTVGRGDSIRVAIMYVSDPAGTGRGLYFDDVEIYGIGTFLDDVTPVDASGFDFPWEIGNEIDFTVTVANIGVLDQSNIRWDGQVLDDDGNVVASPIIGTSTEALPAGGEIDISTVFGKWTPEEKGDYTFKAWTSLAGDGDTENDTLWVDFHVFGNIVGFEPFDNPDTTLEELGWDVDGEGGGVETWYMGLSPFFGITGAVVNFDSLGRPQDESLISPVIDLRYLPTEVDLHFESTVVLGFAETDIFVEVSTDMGANWKEVFHFNNASVGNPGPSGWNIFRDIDISWVAAGQPNVNVRFRYEATNDGDWVVHDVVLSGLGLEPAYVSSVVDIAGDNGLQVRVSWEASYNDQYLYDHGGNQHPIAEYGIWREVPAAAAAGLNSKDAKSVVSRYMLASEYGTAEIGSRYYVETMGHYFDFVGSVLAHSDSAYSYVAPTLWDGVSTGFMVSAHTADPLVFEDSNVEFGTSTDDLAPAPPSGLAGSVINTDVNLTWLLGDPDDKTFKENNVYRGTTSNTADMTQLASTSANEYTDATAEIGVDYYYAVTSVDHAGNESDFSNVAPVTITGIGDETSLPTEFALRQNYPNPFNPSTTISYSLPTASDVKIVVYNLLGNEIATLVNGQQAAGYHNVEWNGRSDSGKLVSTGIYFYRINADDFTAIRKMILMK
ncbi:MAG: T9SS type A sorting domain-containing protein [Candidatus Marinimicrobia bacterium]|nr:T9SS type A sorting domain-containing protein [Candidatus Neomarinimicrobiota bacterium]